MISVRITECDDRMCATVTMPSSDDEEVNALLDVVSFLCDGQRKNIQDMFGMKTPFFAVIYAKFPDFNFMIVPFFV